MGVVERFNRKLKELKDTINKGIQTSIQKNEQVLVKQQTDVQFDEGKDSNSISFIPSYATSTIIAKRRKGQPTDRVTLKDTGDLYKSISIKANTTQAVISASVPYFNYLVTHYKNNSILGIQDDAMEAFLVRYTLPEIEKNFKAIISK
jgi:phage gpG-like protein